MKTVTLIARILLGLGFTVFGLVGLMNLAPPPPDLPEKLVAFTNGMMATGYFFQFVKGTEVICGLLLLSGYFVPLALVVLAPILINIILLHAFLQPSGIAIGLILGALEVYLAFFAEPYKHTIKQLFRAKQGFIS